MVSVDSERAAGRIEALRKRAALLVDRGEFQLAERELLRALKLLGPHRRRPTPQHLSSWNELGIVYKYLGKFGKARKLYRSALFYCDSCLKGSARCDLLANLYHNLGGLEHSLRRFRRAEPYARKSVKWRLRVRPRDMVAIAADRVALAAVLDGLGKFEESRRLYIGALRVYRRAFGASHREIALVLNNLAAVYQRTGRVKRAEKMYRTALAMKIKTLGAGHPDVAVTSNNLGMLLAEQGRVGEARRRFERAWKLLRKRLGPNHPNTLAVRKNLERLK
ncbi:MAG TPA: tetratricopeptide repeat protein [Candidatus Eremiobacteraceae bacterium]|nr:tetratricopeptide repeat protein [Candidatus Eremiobacteraceae bacterium]